MQYFELILGSFMMNNIKSFTTNIIWIDLLLFLIFIIGFYCYRDNHISNYIREQIHSFLFPLKENRIKFMFNRGEQSVRCKGLFHYLTFSKNKYKDSKVKNLIEDIFRKWDKHTDLDVEYANIYRVDQIKPFNFTKTIKGRVFTQEKETTEWNGKITYKEFINLVIYSEHDSMEEIQSFIEDCKDKYNKYLKEQMLENQYLITIENIENGKDNNKLKISKEEWISNVTFESRFFPNKENIINSIENFLTQKEWYKKKGLNHTLGILLSGEPGCGKTSFIKALMNYTKRHCIEVKLNDEFDFSDLKDIIYDEEIDDDIIVPQNKRIIVFEDIDAMGNIVKDRNLKEKENEEASNKLESEVLRLISDDKSKSEKGYNNIEKVKSRINKKENNNLSYLLNILDGINETPGRIIIMTTNKPEILDEALIRPGRIDIRINFTKSTSSDLKEILNYFWKDKKDLYRDIENKGINDLDRKITPAEIIDVCRKSSNLNDSIKNLKVLIKKD